MICPNCNSEIKYGMKFCPKCGTGIPQTRYCSECGTELKDGMCFCPKCGIRIVNLHYIPNDKYPFADNIENIINNSESSNSLIQEGKEEMKKGLKYIVIGIIIFICFSLIYRLIPDSTHSTYTQLENNEAEQKQIPSWLFGKWYLRSNHPYIGEFQVAILIKEDGSFAETYQSHSSMESTFGYITDVYEDEIRVKFSVGRTDYQCYPISNSSQKLGYGQGFWLNRY